MCHVLKQKYTKLYLKIMNVYSRVRKFEVALLTGYVKLVLASKI
jgi:hypothetical protein